MVKIEKWITISEYVDLLTGEIITKSKYEREYYKIRSSKKIEIKETIIKREVKTYGYVKYTTECRKKQQLQLFR